MPSDKPGADRAIPGKLLRGIPEQTRTWIEAMFREHEAMRQMIACLEDKNRRLLSLFREAEQRRHVVTSQYVAVAGLLAARNRAGALSVVKDVLMNLIGCEKAAIFEVDPERGCLSLVASMGLDAEQYRTIPVGSGLIGSTALTGASYIAEDEAPAGLTACVPLLLDGEVRGAIALFELLANKPGLTRADRALLELLETHAAIALRATRTGGPGHAE